MSGRPWFQGAGREKRNTVLATRATETERAEFFALAEVMGCSLSDALRLLLQAGYVSVVGRNLGSAVADPPPADPVSIEQTYAKVEP